jgi:inosine-uridine nucleoside N-ribohydrolase
MTTNLTRRGAIGGTLLTGLAAMTPALADPPAAAPATPTNGPRLTGIRRVIVDTDPGNDDALAILLALDAPHLQVDAITVAPGNLGPNYQQQVTNALFLVDLAGKSGRVPVHAGMTHPLLNQPYPVATFIHGRYGLGSFEAPIVRQTVEREHAVDAMRRIVKTSPGEITILALGGLTNIAMAMLRDPEMVMALKGIVFVGGRYAAAPPVPSYNVLVDPEAADIVFKSGTPITLVGADVFNRDSILEAADFDHIATFGTARSRFFIASNELRRTFETSHRGTTGATNPDGMTVATVIDTTIGRAYVPLYVHVELQGALTRGMIIFGDNIYTNAPTPPPNVDLCVHASRDAFKQMVFTMLAKS